MMIYRFNHHPPGEVGVLLRWAKSFPDMQTLNLQNLSYLAQWIQEIPSRIETLENYKLDELIAYAEHLKKEAARDWRNLLLVNTRAELDAIGISFPEEKEAAEICTAVEAERARRVNIALDKEAAEIRTAVNARRVNETLAAVKVKHPRKVKQGQKKPN